MSEEIRTFDAKRAMLDDYLQGYPARLNITDPQPLEEALAEGQLALDTRLLTFEHQGVLYVFPMAVVLSYNVLQGQINEQSWMMTFCNACNTGMVFDPVIEGRMLHFRRRGAYDGLLLIWDEETNSYWQHVTGRALFGPSEGKQLRIITTTRQMTAAEAAARSMKVLLLSSTLSSDQQTLSKAMEKMRQHPEKLESGILSTANKEDTRRPRFELGLGVWEQGRSIFFPLELLHQQDGVMDADFNGKHLLVYQAPEALSPVAAYLDSRRAVWEGDTLRLDEGMYIQNDMLFGANGRARSLDRPMQLLMRWYGFAATFPGCSLPDIGSDLKLKT